MWKYVLVFILFLPDHGFSSDKLSIISPHRKSIQQEFVPKFKEYYKKKI